MKGSLLRIATVLVFGLMLAVPQVSSQIVLGGAEGDSYLYFYEDGSVYGEFLLWDDSADVFEISDDLVADGTVQGNGTTGVYGESGFDYGEGVQGHGTGQYTEGVLGTSDQGAGVYGISAAASGSNAIGVWGQTSATWGFYTGQSMYVGGNCTGCSVAFVAQSEEDGPLDVGEVVSVSGIGPPLMGQQAPTLKVRRAARTKDGLLGIVQGRATVSSGRMLVPTGDSFETWTTEIASAAMGRVASGDYLFIVVQGLVQVRADASLDPIEVGDPVGPVTAAGIAQKLNQDTESNLVLGRALEPLTQGSRLIWVLILGR